MIKVALMRDSNDMLCGFEVTGHAGHAPKGHDIVCAGVSALTDTTALSLTRLLGDRAKVQASAGRLSCLIPTSISLEERDKVQLLIEHMTLGLSEIARLYPGHVEVSDASKRK